MGGSHGSWGSLQVPMAAGQRYSGYKEVQQATAHVIRVIVLTNKKAGRELPPPPPLTPGQYQSRSDPRLPPLYAPTQMFPTRSRSPGLPSSYHTQQDYLPYPPGCRLDLRQASWYHPINHLIPPHNHRSPPCTPARRKDGWCRRCRPRQGKRLNPPRTLPLAAQAWEGD